MMSRPGPPENVLGGSQKYLEWISKNVPGGSRRYPRWCFGCGPGDVPGDLRM
jgi:hypothetical protein